METVNTETLPILGKKGITGSTLKMIAMAAMLIDHIGALIIERAMFFTTGNEMFVYDPTLTVIDMVMRKIGRIAFPIFVFLLIEGFMHTRNVWKYALRLGIFAVLSEIPFNLGFSGRIFLRGYQNTFFTLLIGLLVIIAIDKTWKEEFIARMLKIVLCLSYIVVGMMTAQFIHSDYGAVGVASIVVLYLFRWNRANQIFAGCIIFCREITAPLAFLPVAAYNGKRGWNMKYVFYAFYPIHLLLLYLIARLIGIA